MYMLYIHRSWSTRKKLNHVEGIFYMFSCLNAEYVEIIGGMHIYRRHVPVLHVGTYDHENHLYSRILQSAESLWRHFLSCLQQACCFEFLKHIMLVQLIRNWFSAGGMHCKQQNIFAIIAYNALCTLIHAPLLAAWLFRLFVTVIFQQWSVQVCNPQFDC